MRAPFSILILPQGGRRIHRLFFSQRSLRYLMSAAVALLAAGGWLLGDYLWMKAQKKELAKLGEEALAHRERLTALEEQTKNVQELLAKWKSLRQKVQTSLPTRSKFSTNGAYPIEELEKSLASLRGELEQLIAAIPSDWPVSGRVTSGVGTRLSPWTGKPEFHSGIDIPNPIGTPVYAPGDGIVEWAGGMDGNGRTVVLNHGQGITTLYAHLSKMHVRKGERVRRGQRIADVGNTGKSTSPHLHYEVRVYGVAIDPRRQLLKRSFPPS